MIFYMNDKMTNSYKIIIEPDKITEPDRVIRILNISNDLHLTLYYKSGKVKFIDLDSFKRICFSLKWFINHQIKKACFFDAKSYKEHLVSQEVLREFRSEIPLFL